MESQTKTIRAFQLHDKQWLEELHAHGVVIVKNALAKEQVQQAISLFWDWMENLKSGLQRNNSDTWLNSAWPGLPDMGFFTSYGGAHSKASWYMRTRPKVQQAFATIWECKQLITSFDTFIAWRPWWHDPTWKPYVENLHVDQNPSAKKGFHCVQGMVPLYKVDEVGGLAVVPDTSDDHTQTLLETRYPMTTMSNSDWLELNKSDPFIGKGVLAKCDAGDLILWDSRAVHGGLILQPSEQFKKAHNKNELVRLAMTVTMVPKSLASERTLERRRKAFKERIALTHWPHEYNVSGMGRMAKDIDRDKMVFEEVELTEEIKQLIG